MAQHDGDNTAGIAAVNRGDTSVGTAVIAADAFENPGLPPHRDRVTDLDPKKDKQAERRVISFFLVSMVATIFTIVAYIVFPIAPGDPATIRLNNLLLGLGISLGLLSIGFGGVYWAKTIMKGGEWVEARHPTRGSDDTRAAAAEIFRLGNEESGFGRRKMLRNTLIGALALVPLPGIVLLRDLAPAANPVDLFRKTLWDKGVHLTRDPSGLRIKASEVTLGSVFHVIPEGLNEAENKLEEKAKAVVLLMRLRPEDLADYSERGKSWSYEGIVAYSKICTHVGCPVALYEQHTHHLLCPCHQSQFDITQEAKVIFGPAKRPLPQLPIAVDAEGYLIATSDFHEPVGPSFWERSL